MAYHGAKNSMSQIPSPFTFFKKLSEVSTVTAPVSEYIPSTTFTLKDVLRMAKQTSIHAPLNILAKLAENYLRTGDPLPWARSDLVLPTEAHSLQRASLHRIG